MSISIVTPCFNGAEYLEDTIKSVLNQNYPNLEYVIIDGGSTDGSVEIIKRYESQLTYWISEKDSGMYDAINKGFSKTTGEVMAWINADDMFYPGSFDIMAELISLSPEIRWFNGKGCCLDEKGRTVKDETIRSFSRYDFLNNDYKWTSQPSMFWHRSLWDQAGGIDSNLKYAGDFELQVKFFRYAKLQIVNVLIGGFRIRTENQLSLEHIGDYFTEADEIIKKEIASLNPKESREFRQFKMVSKILALFDKFKLFDTNRIFDYYKAYKFGRPNDLKFNRDTQSFEYEIYSTKGR